MPMISKVNFEKKISNKDRKLNNFFEKIVNEDTQIINMITENEQLKAKLESAEQIICIMSECELPKFIINIIQNAYQNSVRVYLLTKKIYPSYRGTITGKCIIRILGNIAGTFILLDPVEQLKYGTLVLLHPNFSTTSSKASYIYKAGEICKDAFHYFCYQFWHWADCELLDEGEPKAIESVPYDVYPLIGSDYIVYDDEYRRYFSEEMSAKITVAKKEIKLSTNIIEVGTTIWNLLCEKSKQGINVTLVLSNLKENEEIYDEIVRKNYNISFVVVDSCVQSSLGIDGSVYYCLGCDLTVEQELNNTFFGARVDKNDIDIVEKAFKTVWRFCNNKDLGNIYSNIISPFFPHNENEVYEIKDNHVIDLGCIKVEHLADLKNESYEKYVKVEEDSKAFVKNIIYKGELMPIYREKGCSEHPIYSEWQKQANIVNNYLIEFEKYIQKCEEDKKSLTGKILRFVGIGQNIHKDALNEIEHISREIKVGIRSRDDYNKLRERINKIHMMVMDANKRIQLESYKNKQEEEWQENRTTKSHELENLSNDLLSKEKELQDCSNPGIRKEQIESNIAEMNTVIEDLELEISVIRDDVPSFTHIENTERNVQKLCDKVDDAIKKVGNVKKQNKKQNQYSGQIGEIKKMTKDITGNNTYFDEKLNTLNGTFETKLESMKKYIMENLLLELLISIEENEYITYKNLKDKQLLLNNKKYEKEMLEKDLKNIENECSRSATRLSNEIRVIKSKIEQKDIEFKKMGEEFVFDPSSFKLKEPGLVSFDSSGKVPQFDLPTVGKLYKLGQKNYLAISSWEEYDIAEREAAEYNAELVCEI